MVDACSYCKRDLSPSLFQCRVSCVDCSFEQCADCFAAGAVLYPHLTSHRYKVADCLDFPIFSKEWTAREELLLVEGVQRFGAGNARQISEYLQSVSTISSSAVSNKSSKQVEDRYWDLYLGVHGYCLPSRTISVDGSVTCTQTVIDGDNADYERQGQGGDCRDDTVTLRNSILTMSPSSSQVFSRVGQCL